jgi:hypothetical protein
MTFILSRYLSGVTVERVQHICQNRQLSVSDPMKMAVLRDVTPRRLVDIGRCFSCAHCLQHLGVVFILVAVRSWPHVC